VRDWTGSELSRVPTCHVATEQLPGAIRTAWSRRVVAEGNSRENGDVTVAEGIEGELPPPPPPPPPPPLPLPLPPPPLSGEKGGTRTSSSGWRRRHASLDFSRCPRLTRYEFYSIAAIDRSRSPNPERSREQLTDVRKNTGVSRLRIRIIRIRPCIRHALPIAIRRVTSDDHVKCKINETSVCWD